MKKLSKKNYIFDFIIILLQLIVFYLLPLTAGPTDMMGLVVLIIIITFVLSILIGVFSSNRFKCFYPVIVSLTYIPSILIYYNSSAIIHALWYLVDSIIGLIVGFIISEIIKIIKA